MQGTTSCAASLQLFQSRRRLCECCAGDVPEVDESVFGGMSQDIRHHNQDALYKRIESHGYRCEWVLQHHGSGNTNVDVRASEQSRMERFAHFRSSRVR